MASRESAVVEITPEVLLKAYACGIFPMAESAEDPALYWIEPENRGVIPLDRFHVPARLARTVRADQFTVVVDRNFDAVISGCAASMPGRARTWINTRIRNLYRKLYERGDCHTVEVYQDGYNPRSVRVSHGSWIRFVASRGDLDEEQRRAFEGRAGGH